MKIFNLLFIAVELVHASSRLGCSAGENEYCESWDGEGACCSRLVVKEVNADGNMNYEAVDSVLYKCYDIIDITDAIDNNNVLVDTSQGGSGNTYEFSCSEPNESAILGSITMFISWGILAAVAVSATI